LRSSASSPAHCCGLSRSRDTGHFDLSASVPPSRQARCHRHTEPSVTRRSSAIWLIASPRANRPATDQMIRHGVHKSVQALEADIRAWTKLFV